LIYKVKCFFASFSEIKQLAKKKKSVCNQHTDRSDIKYKYIYIIIV